MRVTLSILLSVVLLSIACESQKSESIHFAYAPAPQNSGFKMDDHWVWGASMIKVQDTYHLFASRWPKESHFPEGYRQNSEIVRATSSDPLGPYELQEVVIGERDSSFWDANMAHNPTIHRIGNEFVLFYIGSDFTTYRTASNSLHRCIGYATAKTIKGPWLRSDQPIIERESNNPAILIDGERILLMYRDEKLRIFLAEADSYKGPYTTINDDVWPEHKLEDFYLFSDGQNIHMICEDNVAGLSGHERWGVHLFSGDGGLHWKKYDPVVVYDHEIMLEADESVHCNRRERPQLLIEENRITYLITSVYDGENSWSQPVKVREAIRLGE